MQDRVAENRAERGIEPGRILDAVEHGGAQQRRRQERLAPQGVEDQEPDRDGGGAQEAGDRAFAQDRALVRHRR